MRPRKASGPRAIAAQSRSQPFPLRPPLPFALSCLFMHEFMHDLGERRLIGVVEIIFGVELCDNYHTLPLWCGAALVRCACRDASLRPDWLSGSAQGLAGLRHSRRSAALRRIYIRR